MRSVIRRFRKLLSHTGGKLPIATESFTPSAASSMIFRAGASLQSVPHQQLSYSHLASLPTPSSSNISNPPLPHVRQFSSSVAAQCLAERSALVSCQASPTSAKKAKVELRPTEDSALLGIPGVGPKYAQLLTAAGYTNLHAVQQWFQTECSNDVNTFMKQLEGRIGIRFKKHRENIARYISSLEESPQTHAREFSNNYVTLSVEGNISAGKSTFLNGITAHCPDLQDLIHVAPEPVDRWQNVGNHNLLDKFYHDKQRYAYTFQNYIFFTRMMQEQDSAKAMSNQPYRLLERSVFCDRMVFVESLKDSNILSEMELSIYDSWFDPVVKMSPTLVPDGFIYLRATPQTCMSRLKNRNRDEETAVDISYLEDLHRRHDDWLYELHAKAVPNLDASFKQMDAAMGRRPELIPAEHIKAAAQSSLTAPEIPDMIRAEVRLLNKESNMRLHSAIHKLPALVLDCEKDLGDLDAQKEHAAKVNTYFEYVKETRKHRAMFMALEGLTNESRTLSDVQEKFNLAREMLDPATRPIVDAAFSKAMADVQMNPTSMRQVAGAYH